MAHAFLTVTVQVLHTPEPSKAIAWGPCSCWMYSTLPLHCHHRCPSVRVASCQVLCWAEPSKSGWWGCVFNMLWWQHATSSCTDPVCTLSLPKGIGAVPRSPQLRLQTPPTTLWSCPVHWFSDRGVCFNGTGKISQKVQSSADWDTWGGIVTTERGHFIFGHMRQREAPVWLRDKRNICLHLAELAVGSVYLVVNHELLSRRCLSLLVRLSAAGGGSILVQGSVLMLCRSALLSSGARLSWSGRWFSLSTKQP